MLRPPPRSTPFPYPTPFRSAPGAAAVRARAGRGREPTPEHRQRGHDCPRGLAPPRVGRAQRLDARRARRSPTTRSRDSGNSAIPNPKSAIPMTIYPLTFQLGPLTITGYGIMMMVAFLMAGWAIQVELRRRGMNEDYAADIVFAAVVGGIVGAKIWYVLLTGEWDALFRRGGVVWYGGGFLCGGGGAPRAPGGGGGGGPGRGGAPPPPPPARRVGGG